MNEVRATMNKKKILIVVDAQNDFVTGSLANEEAKKVIPELADYLRFNCANHQYDRIYFTRDSHTEDYLETLEGKHLPVPHCIVGTSGWCVVDDLLTAVRHNYTFKLPTATAVFVEKTTFGYTDWRMVFRKYNDDDFDNCIDSITLVGFCTDICVVSNALILKALYPNAEIKVLSSLCAGVTPEKHEAALEVMRSCQIEVI